ncbi:hypothetical protein ACWD25_22445 [Streptomyces sp. NPDC002920]|uniref:Uncharacterized protein n=1 Tax=Streptomyces mangrovi TaxID=1206892 RepID=A0ABV9IKI2_9ACTN
MTAIDVRELAMDALALMLYRAAAPAGRCAEDLLASLSDAELSALYLSCAERICRKYGPPPDCPAGATAPYRAPDVTPGRPARSKRCRTTTRGKHA